MLATLDTNMKETTKLVESAKSQDERNDARNRILELKNQLQMLKENVLREAREAKTRGDYIVYKDYPTGPYARYGNETTRRITSWVREIADKVPQITQLEKKIGML